MERKTIKVNFDDGSNVKTACGLTQYDHNMVMEICGLDLPDVVEVQYHAAGCSHGTVSRMGSTASGVTAVEIPNFLTEQPGTITAYICVAAENSAWTEKTAKLPVTPRQKPGNEPEQETIILQKLNEIAGAKADKNQGTENAGKLWAVGEDGNVRFADMPETVKVRPIADVAEYGYGYAYNEILNWHYINLLPTGAQPDACFYNDAQAAGTIVVSYNGSRLVSLDFPPSELACIMCNKDYKTVQLYCNGSNVKIKYDESGTAKDPIIDLAVRTSKVLTKTNTDEYTPTADYHPATKKYVDDNCKSAYKYAQKGGYTGTEEEFAQKLAALLAE